MNCCNFWIQKNCDILKKSSQFQKRIMVFDMNFQLAMDSHYWVYLFGDHDDGVEIKILMFWSHSSSFKVNTENTFIVLKI